MYIYETLCIFWLHYYLCVKLLTVIICSQCIKLLNAFLFNFSLRMNETCKITQIESFKCVKSKSVEKIMLKSRAK